MVRAENVSVGSDEIGSDSEELFTSTKGPTSLQSWSSGRSELANDSETCRGRPQKTRDAWVMFIVLLRESKGEEKSGKRDHRRLRAKEWQRTCSNQL
jgi:hypothetical protein